MNDEMTAATRPGSGPDVSRRLDRMEARQDTIEVKVTDLSAVVSRVELNQKHAEDLAVLRFGALDTAVKSIDGTLERFMGRINAIVSGEVKLPQAAQGEALVADYVAWRKDMDKWREARENSEARQSGIFATFTGAKAVLLTLAAIASPLITVIALLLK